MSRIQAREIPADDRNNHPIPGGSVPLSPDAIPGPVQANPDFLFQAMPLALTVLDPGGRIQAVNPAAEALLGLPASAQVGLSLEDSTWQVLGADGTVMPCEAFPGLLALREGVPVEGVLMGVLRPDGRRVWLDVSAKPLPDGTALLAFTDATERYRDQAILEARARLVLRAPDLDLEGLLRATLDEAEGLTESCIGFFHFVEEDGQSLKLQAWSTRTERDYCRAEGKGSHYPVSSAGIWADCLREGRALIHNDYASHPGRKGLPEGHAQVLREITVPVLRRGRPVAVIGLGNKAHPYFEWEVEAVRRLADLAWDLAERKRAEADLIAKEMRHHRMLQTAHDGVWLTDREARLVEVNNAAALMLGYTVDELTGLNVADVEALESPRVIQERVQRLMMRGWDRFETRHRRKDGQEIPVEVAATWLAESSQTVVFVRDIRERKLAEESVRASEEKFRTIFNVSPDGMAITRASDGVVLEMNRGMEVLSGFEMSETMGRNSTQMGFWVDLEERERLIQILRQQGKIVGYQARFRCKDGQEFLGAMSAAMVKLGDVPCILSSTRNITPMLEAQEALRESQQQLDMIFKAASDGLFLLAVEGEGLYRCVSVNPAFSRITGIPAETLQGKRVDELLPPETPAMGLTRVAEAIRENRTVRWEETVNFPSGSTVGIVTVTPAWNPDGACTHLIGSVHDITASRRAEAENRQLMLQLAHTQKMESLGTLASGVAHDMNNVLGAILGLASACQETFAEGTPFHKAMGTISTACERGRVLVRGLLDFTRRDLAQEQVVDLNALVREEVALLARTTLQRVRLESSLDPDLRPLCGDPSSLSHLLMNLCVNAVDAMPEGGILTIRTFMPEPGQIALEVADTGIGMTPEVKAKALEPFFTTKPHGKGTGLGLSMVFGTVKAHGGSLEIKSEPGQGTCISLRFPACKAAPAAVPAPIEETKSDRGPGRRILLVDDDELIRSSMEMLLEVLGCDHTAVESGEDALALIQDGLRPELVILDMNMPGIGGAGTLPRLRDLVPEIPVLLATGRVDHSAQALLSLHPHVTLLPKPYSLEMLREHLERLEK